MPLKKETKPNQNPDMSKQNYRYSSFIYREDKNVDELIFLTKWHQEKLRSQSKWHMLTYDLLIHLYVYQDLLSQ